MNGPVTPSLTDTVLTDEKRMAIVQASALARRRFSWRHQIFCGDSADCTRRHHRVAIRASLARA